MTSDEVENLIASFRQAASLARKAGFDGVEIHGANHYAVHQFFSPRANRRDDKWGGTLAKRMNFPLAVAQAVRDALGPELIAGFRVTPFEAEADGYTLEDAKVLCGELAGLNFDYISVSLDDYRMSRPAPETRVYSGPVERSNTPAESPITAFARVIAGRSAVYGERWDQDVRGCRRGTQIGRRSGRRRTRRGGRSGMAFQGPKQE